MARDHVGTGLPASLVWSCDAPRERLAQLYEMGKASQWNAATDLDWTVDVDPGRAPQPAAAGAGGAGSAGCAVDWSAFGDPLTTAVGTGPEAVHAILTQHHAWFVSQLLHGEQGALVGMAKVCAAAESLEAKCCAALQMADEARHVEAYRRYLDKIGVSYPVCPGLRDLLTQAVGHRSYDLTYVGTQILVESLGLAVAQVGEGVFGNPLLCRIMRLVEQDEARHVAFGAAALDGLYDQMDPVERREREDFVLDACALLRVRFRPDAVWEHFGVDADAAAACFADSPDVAAVHSLAFARIVPHLQRIGLLTERVRQGLEAQGVLRFGRRTPPAPGRAVAIRGAGNGVDALGGVGGMAEAWDGAANGVDGVDWVEGIDGGDAIAVEPAGLAAGEAADPLLALRAALGCVEQIEPEPVLLAMSGLADRVRLAGIPRATIRLEVAGPSGEGTWLVTVADGHLSYRRASVVDPADVVVGMDLATWTEMVAGRVTMPVALAGGRITVTGDIFKARALEAVL